jgi:hypothetical protein
MVNRFTLLVLSFVLLASMVGCGSSQVQPTNTPVPTSTSVPTATTIPTNTILPTNTAIPTATVIPTATPVPPTPTFSPADPVQTLEANGFVLQDTTCDSTCAYYWNEQHFIMAEVFSSGRVDFRIYVDPNIDLDPLVVTVLGTLYGQDVTNWVVKNYTATQDGLKTTVLDGYSVVMSLNPPDTPGSPFWIYIVIHPASS